MAGFSVKAKPDTGTGAPTDMNVPTNTVLGRVDGNIVAAQLVEGQIADEAITLAKMAHVATDTFMGRISGATGDVEELTNANAKTMLDLTGTNSGDGAAHAYSVHSGTIPSDDFADDTIAVSRLVDGTDGELITWSTSGVATTVGAGTDTQVLTSHGPDTVPTFENASSGSHPSLSKSVTIPDPVTGEDVTLFYTPVAITITQIAAVIRGTTPSVLWFIKHATMTTGRDSAGAAVITAGTTTTDEGGVSITTFDDDTIPADSFLWVETTTVSGTNDELALTVVYTED
jgi:hypothetical protein